MSKKVRNSKKSVNEYAIAPMPITDGPRYDHPDIQGIAMRKIGATKRLCYLVKVPAELAAFVPAYDKKLSDEILRGNHCRVISEKTGKPIICDHKSCYSCPKAGKLDMQTCHNASLEYLDEQGIEIATYDTTSDAATAHLKAEELIAELKQKSKKLDEIGRLSLQEYEAKEIIEELHTAKSTIYDGINRMREIAEDYI